MVDPDRCTCLDPHTDDHLIDFQCPTHGCLPTPAAYIAAALKLLQDAPAYRPPVRYLSPAEAATLGPDGLTASDRITVEVTREAWRALSPG